MLEQNGIKWEGRADSNNLCATKTRSLGETRGFMEYTQKGSQSHSMRRTGHQKNTASMEVFLISYHGLGRAISNYLNRYSKLGCSC